MSCNQCYKTSCSCPNSNCACPPDYSVNPATISCPDGTICEDTISTQCIFTASYLSCTKTAAGLPLDEVLQAMDQKICECGSCSGTTLITPSIASLSDYYVDSLNTITGDGSVINPFQTIEEAHNKIIGAGTRTNPDNPNVTVHVAEGVGYTTNINIYIPGITYIFAPSSYNITYTGSGTYFIDTSVISNGAVVFKVIGHLNFTSSTGGLLKNESSYYTSDKTVYLEVNSATSTMNATGMPFIYHNQTNVTAAGQGIAHTSIKLATAESIIISSVQTTISVNGGYFYADLNGGRIWYGYNVNSGSATGLSSGNVLYYNNIDNSAFNYQATFIFKNGAITSLNALDMIYTAGNFSYYLIENIKVATVFNTNKPNSFLNIGTSVMVQTVSSNYEFTLLLKDLILEPNAFATTAGINYTGAGNSFDYLNMQNCILYSPLTIDTQFRLGLISQGLVPVATRNIIKGNVRFTNLPTSSAGLTTGELWSNAGVLTII